MHEHLKFTVQLDPNTETFKTFDNGYKENDSPSKRAEVSDWQAIFSENSPYGSNFFIYAKFIGKHVDATDSLEAGLEISKIQLYLQSYTGMISLGFADASLPVLLEPDVLNEESHDPDKDLARYPFRKKYHLLSFLEGFKIDSCQKDITPSFPKSKLILRNGDLLVVHTMYYPAITEHSKIFVKQSDLSQLPRLNSNFADPAFMTRMGEDVLLTHNGVKVLEALYHLNIIEKDKLDQAGVPTPQNRGNFDVKEFLYNQSTQIPFTEPFSSLSAYIPCRSQNSIFKY